MNNSGNPEDIKKGPLPELGNRMLTKEEYINALNAEARLDGSGLSEFSKDLFGKVFDDELTDAQMIQELIKKYKKV